MRLLTLLWRRGRRFDRKLQVASRAFHDVALFKVGTACNRSMVILLLFRSSRHLHGIGWCQRQRGPALRTAKRLIWRFLHSDGGAGSCRDLRGEPFREEHARCGRPRWSRDALQGRASDTHTLLSLCIREPSTEATTTDADSRLRDHALCRRGRDGVGIAEPTDHGAASRERGEISWKSAERRL